jgi:DNA-binding transcriptional MerR regulator
MFSIGELSRITGLSIKALRLYHEKELLNPTEVDPTSGYRYYDETSVEKARVIAHLRGLEFSLDDIKEVLACYEDGSDIVAYLEEQRGSIQTKMQHYTNIAATLTQLISREKEIIMKLHQDDFEVEEKTLEPMLIAGIRFKGRYDDCGDKFKQLGKHFGRFIAGPPLNLYYDEGYKEEDADIETCFPVRETKEVEGISVRELPGGKCVSLIHKGSYDDFGITYQKIGTYIKAKGHRVTGPCREIYLKGPGMIFKGNPNNYLTEIQFMVE